MTSARGITTMTTATATATATITAMSRKEADGKDRLFIVVPAISVTTPRVAAAVPVLVASNRDSEFIDRRRSAIRPQRRPARAASAPDASADVDPAHARRVGWRRPGEEEEAFSRRKRSCSGWNTVINSCSTGIARDGEELGGRKYRIGWKRRNCFEISLWKRDNNNNSSSYKNHNYSNSPHHSSIIIISSNINNNNILILSSNS